MFVHITDNNTTVYLDERGEQIVVWSGPVTIDGYDISTNPLNLRNQLLKTTIDGEDGLVFFDAQKTPYLISGRKL